MNRPPLWFEIIITICFAIAVFLTTMLAGWAFVETDDLFTRFVCCVPLAMSVRCFQKVSFEKHEPE